MALTNAQLLALKAAIAASTDQNVINARLNGDHGPIAAFFNALAAPAVKVWKPVVTVADLNKAIVWSAFAGRSVQEQNTYQAMIALGWIDATDPQVRGGFASVFGAASTSVANIIEAARRDGTRFETLAGVSANSGTSPNNALVSQVFGYVLSNQDVADAMAAV